MNMTSVIFIYVQFNMHHNEYHNREAKNKIERLI